MILEVPFSDWTKIIIFPHSEDWSSWNKRSNIKETSLSWSMSFLFYRCNKTHSIFLHYWLKKTRIEELPYYTPCNLFWRGVLKTMRSLSKREQYHNINNLFWKTTVLFFPSLVLMSFKERLMDSLRNSITPYLKAVVPRLSRRFDVNREFWAPSVGSKVEINAPVFYNCLLFFVKEFFDKSYTKEEE